MPPAGGCKNNKDESAARLLVGGWYVHKLDKRTGQQLLISWWSFPKRGCIDQTRAYISLPTWEDGVPATSEQHHRLLYWQRAVVAAVAIPAFVLTFSFIARMGVDTVPASCAVRVSSRRVYSESGKKRLKRAFNQRDHFVN